MVVQRKYPIMRLYKRIVDLRILYQAPKQLKIICSFLFLFLSLHTHAQITDSILNTTADTSRYVESIPTLSADDTMDLFRTNKKEVRTEKAKKIFKFFSYFNYHDRGYGKDFSGIDKYYKYAGKHITCVDIVIFKPFGCTEDSCPSSLSKGQKFGNSIHFKSKEWFVRGDIFFTEGDTVNPTLFADTERQLWDRKKFKDIQILIMPDSTDADNVEVMIFLQDKLSYTVAAGYSNNRVVIFGSTYNFFGLPNTLTLFSGVNFNKHNLWAVGGTYLYENIQSSQINFKTQFTIEQLNRNVAVQLNRKFFNLKTQWAFDVQYAYNNRTVSLNGNILDPSSYVHAKSNYYYGWLAYAVQVNKIAPCKDEKLKLIFAAKGDYTKYNSRPFIVDLNFNESFINQWNYRFGIGLARWDYYLERNAFSVDIAEYFPRGLSMSMWVGPQHDELAGRRIYLSGVVNYGKYIKKFGYLYTQATHSGYLRDRHVEQLLSSLSLSYVSKQVPFAKHMFYRQIIKANSNLGFFVPEERYFNINDVNGIRGFYSPSLKGSKSVTVSAEVDLFLDKKVIMSKGMVYAFCDVGWLSRNGKKLIVESQFQYGVGFGLRFRSVDLGFPYLDFQFSVYPRGKDFGARPFQFKLYEQNFNAIEQNNMFADS